MLESLERLERLERRLERYLPEAPPQQQAQHTDTRNAAQAFLDELPPGASLTEHLLTSPDAFGIATATPAQRALCRILDGVPLDDLEDHPDVVALVGGADAVLALPSEQGHKPHELVLLAAIRAAKTIVACAAAIRMALTVDVTGVSPSETVRVSIVSLALDLASKAYGTLSGTVESSPKLSKLLLGTPRAGKLFLAHPSGRAVEVSIAAGKKAGGSLIADWSAGVIFDEAPRMNGASDAVVNLDDARKAVLGRLLPGAQALYIGSPWAQFGPVYDMVQKGWRKPAPGCVVLRGTGPLLNPVWWTPAQCQKVQDADDGTYQTDVLGEFAAPEGGLLKAAAVKRNTRGTENGLPGPIGDLPYEIRGRYFAHIDSSDGTSHGNPWTLVIVKREQRPGKAFKDDGSPLLNADGTHAIRMLPYYRTALVREWRGKRPGEVLEDAAKVLRGYGLNRATTDQYAGAANADLARQHHLQLEVWAWTPKEKLEAYTNLATLVDSDQVELHADSQFQRDIASVRKRTTQQGVAIVLPQMGDGRHCDYAPALTSAVEKAAAARGGSGALLNTGSGTRWDGSGGRGF